MISIRWRLTLLLCVSIGALFIAAGVGVFLTMHQVLRAQFDEVLTAKARALVTASEIDDGDFEIDLTVQDFAGFGPHDGDDFFEVRRLDGEVLLRSPSLKDDDSLHHLHPPPFPAARIKDGKLADGRPARFYLQRILPKGDKKQRYQDLYLVVASPTRGLNLQLALLALVLGVTGLAALLLMLPLVRLGLRRGLRPLGELAQEIGRIEPESLDQRLPTARLPAELIPLATGLNGWLGRLQSSFERERRFSSHAAHELRTPLAELKSMAELGSMWPEEATPERCAEILAVADELQALLEKLSLLARTESGREPIAREAVDLPASIATALARLEPQAAARQIVIRTAAAGTLVTDPVWWSTILQNLLSNAIDHSPAGCEVTIDADPTRLVVANPAPDLSPTDLEHLFERFWRKDASRTGYGHSGLGLSIVHAGVRLLGGTCHASLSPAGSLHIAIGWPAAADNNFPAVLSTRLPAAEAGATLPA